VVSGSSILVTQYKPTLNRAQYLTSGPDDAPEPLKPCPLQENVPAEVRERVTKEILEELARCLGLPSASSLPSLLYTRVQLWGAALPQNSPGVPCIWDPQGRAGVCGDWVAGGGSMQARQRLPMLCCHSL
jgi:hypothetical protein